MLFRSREVSFPACGEGSASLLWSHGRGIGHQEHWGSPPKSQELLLAIHKHCQSLSENICLLVLDPGSCPPQSDLSQTAAFCSLGQFCIKMDTIRMIVVVMSLSNLRLFVFICLLLSLPPIHFCGRVHTQVAWCRSKLKCAFSRPHERQSVCLVILM